MKRQRNTFMTDSMQSRSSVTKMERTSDPLSEKDACVLRHDRIRLFIILGALLLMIPGAILFFLWQMILPMLIATALSVVAYCSVNTKLRAVERTHAS